MPFQPALASTLYSTSYVFDRRLRNLVFNEMEKIEVAVRTELSSVYSLSTKDAFWYNNKSLFETNDAFQKVMKDIESDVNRSNEDFIKHYRKKYDYHCTSCKQGTPSLHM